MSRSSSPAAVLARLIVAGGAIALAVLAATGCQPTANGQPLLTDPAEIVMAGARSTAALHTVHLRMDVTFRTDPNAALGGGMPIGGQMSEEVDADLDTRNFAARTMTAMQGFPATTSDVILVGGQQFSRSTPDGRWMQFPQFGAPAFPTNDQLVEALSSVIEGGGVDLQLAEQEACGEVTCYHVVATVDPAVEWQLLAPLTGGGGAAPAGFNLPPLTLHLLIDQPTRHLAGGNTDFSFMGVSASVTFTLTNPDAEIVISAPPPALVDQMGNGFGGGVITDVGGEIAPVPMPAEVTDPDQLLPPGGVPLPSF